MFLFPLIPLTFLVLALTRAGTRRPAWAGRPDSVGRPGCSSPRWGAAGSTSPPSHPYRVSTAEREAVIEQLRRHTIDGRLSMDEFGDRTAEALVATTTAELTATMADLPPLSSVAVGERRSQPLILLVVAAFGVVVGVVGIATGHPYVLVPIAIWTTLVTLRLGWRRRRA